MEKREKNQN